ncbi:MAG: histidinol-phosphate transaminase [Burkholderiales bacterium]|jgi:histidinol-phosphate aminotransferase|nr:histidinol-phosphate transaminase [Burkholderiales bacterium]MCA3162786.1 histidinol-phosphate transaminase [Burkholderiales bacterium]MCA3163883.1 histidinol-phosphate transaminase [Burkholderiales bacterium]MCA3165332.1 histidinol-phosphate transaminase [Burkholderiales bacterium]MCA3170482.1 histidinol-phosphate transaminase [Burkholderiales bacterium]
MNTVTDLNKIPVPAYIQAIAPYVGGKPISEVAREYGLDENNIVKLASNENPLGMPESARQAMLQTFDELARYPDGNAYDIRAALAQKFRVPMDWVTLGNGSNDILVLAGHAFLQPGASAVYSQYSFVVYALATQETGARAIVVPATPGLGHDLEAMLCSIEADTHLVFIANPNNPTGTFLPATEIEAFLQRVPAHVVVVLDEAYNEYLAPEQRFDSVEWVRRFPNLIVSRTFSKAYGLAGLRVGYAIAQAPLTDIMNRIRQPFNVNSLGQAAAVAALHDHNFLQKSYELNRAGYQQLVQAFERLGLSFIPAYGNFVLVKVGNAAAVNQALLKQGVIVRPVANYGLPEWLRISIGLPEENQAFILALERALGMAA